MKDLAIKIIPARMMPVAKKLYWKMFKNLSKADFSKRQYDELSSLKCVVAYNKYGGYCVPESSRHRPAAQKILSNDVHEPKTIEFIMSNCGDGDVVHAGTYFGDFLPAISKGCASGAKVWAFEPNLESYRCAKITLEINSIKNIVLANAGLGEKQEYSLIKTVDENGRSLGGASRIIDKESAGSCGAEVVQVVTIDDVVADRQVSIIQLDVEGHERAALTGALSIIRKCLPIIILEVLPNSTLLGSDWFSENILSLGYRKRCEIHDNSIFSCESKY